MLEDQVTPGRIMVLQWQFRERTRRKYVVYVGQDDNPLFLMINSSVHPLVAGDPDRQRCQMLLPAAVHSFLSADSYLDCSEVFDDCALDEVVEQIAEGEGALVGSLTDDECRAVVAAVADSDVLSDWHKAIIIEAFGL